MAQFQQIVLDYLEHYQPGTYEVLRRARGLRGHMEELVERLYSETERVQARLAEQYPDRSEDLLLHEAEEIAIATILPMPEEQPLYEQPHATLRPASRPGRLSAVTQASRHEQPNGREA